MRYVTLANDTHEFCRRNPGKTRRAEKNRTPAPRTTPHYMSETRRTAKKLMGLDSSLPTALANCTIAPIITGRESARLSSNRIPRIRSFGDSQCPIYCRNDQFSSGTYGSVHTRRKPTRRFETKAPAHCNSKVHQRHRRCCP